MKANSNSSFSRRSFIRRAAIAAGAVSATGFLPRASGFSPGANATLNCVQIGCGGRGPSHIQEVIGRHHQVPYAFVDPDERKHRLVQIWLKKNNLDPAKS